MGKEHSVYSLIQTLTSKEKSFFKKHQFSEENETSRTLKLIFDVLNKQTEYSLELLSKNKKLTSSVKKSIHVWLNTLNKKIIDSLIENKKSHSEESQFYYRLEEYDVLMSKKLFDQASKKIKKLEQFAIEKKLFFLIPMLYEKMNKPLLNNVSIKKEFKKSQNQKYEESLIRLKNYAQIRILATKFETLIEENNSIFFTDKDKLKELEEIKKSFEKILAFIKDDFQPIVAINNNLLTINLMQSNEKDLKNTALDFIDLYQSNRENLNVKEKPITFVFFYNIANFNVLLGNNEVFQKVILILQENIETEINTDLLLQIKTYYTNLWSLFYFINPKEELLKEHKELFIKTLESNLKKDRAFFELLTTTSIVLTNQKEYHKSLDLTSQISIADFNERIYDTYIFTKLNRAICWLKLENIDLFESELNSVYKFILKHQSLPYAKEITNIIKKITNEKNNTERKKHARLLYNKFQKVKLNGTFYEKMQVIELLLLLEIALK